MRQAMRRGATGSVCVLALGVLGCGPRLVLNETVEGTIKMEGKPVPNVRVEFLPQMGAEHHAPSSGGFTDEKGYYKLKCENGKPGAIVATHKVVILQGRSAANPDEKADEVPRKVGPPIPPPYTIASRTPLAVEVKEGQSTYDLELKK